MEIKIRQLSQDDDKSDFSCGDFYLDNFFKKFASQNQFKHYIGSTYVLLLEDRIVGFATISASSIRVEELDDKVKKLPHYPLPILRLSRLGIDTRYHKKGFAKELLKFVLRLSMEQKNHFGCIGVIVDAKEKSILFYEKFGFETIDIISGHLDTRPYPQTMFLSMDTIVKALK